MRVAVLGVLEMALVAQVDGLPRAGETVPARALAPRPGGSGVVKALTAAGLGAEVAVYGCVGNDPFGEEVLSALVQAGVRTTAVERVPGLPTGASVVLAGPERVGARSPGANARVDGSYVARHLAAIQEAAVVLVDLTLPAVGSVLRGLPADRPVLGAHPPRSAGSVPWSRLLLVVGTPDELGVEVGWATEPGVPARHPLLDQGLSNLVITGRPEGTYLVEAGGVTRFPGYGLPVGLPGRAVDAFSAACATRLAAGRGLYEAMGFAAAAAALAGSEEDRFPRPAEIVALLSGGPRFPGAPPD